MATVGIDAGERGAHLLLGAGFLLVAEQPERLTDHLARIAVLAGANLAGDELLPRWRQGNVHLGSLS